MAREGSALDGVTRSGPSTAWRATISALCASVVGLGLARFAYTPLLPAIIEAHWFAASDAAYLGAANLAGYLAGALLAVPVTARAPAPAVLRAMMVVATLAFFACVPDVAVPRPTPMKMAPPATPRREAGICALAASHSANR